MMRRFYSFLLLSLITIGFTSCITTDDAFGTDLIPEDQKTKVAICTIDNIPVYTGTIDSIPTLSYYDYTNVFGSINVSPYGNVNANAIFRVYPNVSEHRFTENSQFVSAELEIIISKTTAANDNQKNVVQNIRLYELNKVLYYDTIYYNTSVKDSDYNHDPINLPGVTYNGGDTLRIPLTEAYGKFLMSATNNEMDSLTPFYARYKGFVLGVDSLVNGTGGRLNVVDVSKASLTLKYKDGATGKDTSFFYLSDYACAFSSIHHSSANLANYTTGAFPETQSATIYAEGLAGVKPVINLLDLRDSINAMLTREKLRPEQLLINKAEIIISIPPGATMDHYPSQLVLCSTGTSSEGYPVYKFTNDFFGTNSDGTNPYFGGKINRSLLSYSFNIAFGLQRILKQGDNVTDPTTYYLFPVSYVSDVYSTYHYIIDITGYPYGNLLGTGSNLPVKLNLVYTILPL